MKLLKTCLLAVLFLFMAAPAFADSDDYYDDEFSVVSSNTTTGTIQVGVDNSGAPIFIGYKTQGKNDGRPVLVLGDPYLGIPSWKHIQKKFSKDYFTIAIDNMGYATSSRNAPVDLDGIGGFVGYSFRQQAYFMHLFLQQLNPLGPITFVGVDIQCQNAVWYAHDYPNGPFPITKIFMEDASLEANLSDDPCSLAYVNTPIMSGIVAFFRFDPEAAIRAILGQSFATTECPSVEPLILDLAVAHAIQTTGDIFERISLTSFKEDLSGLMEGITIPVVNTIGLTAPSPITRRGVGLTFFGNSPNFSNPPGQCTECKPIVNPFPDSRFITYPGHGTIQHLTAFKKFVRDLRDFITGDDAACSVRLP